MANSSYAPDLTAGSAPTSMRPALAGLNHMVSAGHYLATQAGMDVPNSLRLLLTFPFSPGAIDSAQGDYVNLRANADLDLNTLLSDLIRGLPQASSGLPDFGSILQHNPLTGTPPGTQPKGKAGKTPTAGAPDQPSSGDGLLGGVLSLLGLGGTSR